jgi:hypothetical protein
MIIVSQNKKRIFNFENLVETGVFVRNIYPPKDNVKRYDLQGVTQNGGCIILGAYDTEERAKEILSEIVTYNANFNLFKCSCAGTQARAAKEFLEKGIRFDIYEMPEK